VNHYLFIKTWISLLTGLVAGVLCWAIGVDFPLLWGLLAFLLDYVPNIGSIIAAVPPVLLALVQLGPGQALAVLVGYLIINNVLGNFVEPRFMGEGLGLSSFAVLLSLVFWGWVLGPVGMLLSIPLTMAVKIAMEEQPNMRWISLLLGSGSDAEMELARQRDLSSADKEPIRRAGLPS
jgi:predicted PurR-regulated permease PerM